MGPNGIAAFEPGHRAAPDVSGHSVLVSETNVWVVEGSGGSAVAAVGGQGCQHAESSAF